MELAARMPGHRRPTKSKRAQVAVSAARNALKVAYAAGAAQATVKARATPPSRARRPLPVLLFVGGGAAGYAAHDRIRAIIGGSSPSPDAAQPSRPAPAPNVAATNRETGDVNAGESGP